MEDRIKKMYGLLIDARYRSAWKLDQKKALGFTLEGWIGARGVIVVQFIHFAEGVSVHVYHAGEVPSKWDELAEWLKQRKSEPQLTPLQLHAPKMKAALERIDSINGSTGGAAALVSDFKHTAALCLAELSDAAKGGGA
jgi:hypothetical protein